MFQDQYRRATDNIHAPETLYAKLKRGQRPPMRNKRLIQAVAAVLVLALLGGGTWGIFALRRPGVGPVGLPQTEKYALATLRPVDLPLTTVSDYDDLYALMQQKSNSGNLGGFITRNTIRLNNRAVGADMEMAVDDVGDVVFSAAPEADHSDYFDEAAPQKDYSGTNTQVLNVDEADIVKTDGDYIYVLSPQKGKLFVVSADGAEMKVTDTVDVPGKPKANESADARNMYVYGDRLFVIVSYNGWDVIRPLTADLTTDETKIGGTVKTNDSRTIVVTFDISDKGNVKKLSEISQSGHYSDSRLTDGCLYIVTSYYNWSGWLEGAPVTYCPTLRDDSGRETLIPAGDILLYEDGGNTSYSVIGAIDCEAGNAYTSTKALFGVSGNIYCDGRNLLLTSYAWQSGYTEEQRDVWAKLYIDNYGGGATNVVLFTLDKGKITQKAAATIPGSLLNQFSMDAWNGHFRFVVTRNSFTQRIYTEGIDTYGDYESKSDNALYILDGDLKTVGKIEGLAEGEHVKSARFAGEIVYFVTFRQVDPLFTVDLSDPANPKVLSALKIPGFSSYLHPFGEGLLVGLGFSADEQTGRTTGVKLSMFDISDKTDVSEKHVQKVKADWTPVMYNHKAILVDVQKNLIAFPADDYYFVYGYDAASGFTEKGKIKLDFGEKTYYEDDARGLYIDGVLYLVQTNAITALDLLSLEKLATLKLKYQCIFSRLEDR